nr:outer membrane lipoprotein-sorting protein [uncultured Psychroserpens sp.]
MKRLFYILVLLLMTNYTSAQNAKAIMAKYTKVTGGEKKWNKINVMSVSGTAHLINQGGMELPFTRIVKKDGKQITSLIVNGMNYVSLAYDGETAWGSNQQMQPEKKSVDVATNTENLKYDFPYPGHNWKKNGYTLEYLEKVMIEGTETFKIKLTKLPQFVDGKSVDNIQYLYIDSKKYIPILTESEVVSGTDKGKITKSFLSDYKEVDGLLFPFTVTMKYEDEIFQILKTTSVEWNKDIDDSLFIMKTSND